jgi:hypothetical protein
MPSTGADKPPLIMCVVQYWNLRAAHHLESMKSYESDSPIDEVKNVYDNDEVFTVRYIFSVFGSAFNIYFNIQSFNLTSSDQYLIDNASASETVKSVKIHIISTHHC